MFLENEIQIKKADIRDDMDRDIDFHINGKSVSVKTHYQQMIYETLPFEIKLYNSRTGQSMPGNFAKCKAEWYVLLLPYDVDITILTINTKTLKQTVAKNYKLGLYRKSNKLNNTARNTNKDRYYDNAVNILVPKKDLYEIATKINYGSQYMNIEDIPENLLYKLN